MPFINSKVTVCMTDAQKEEVKSKLAKAVELIPGKTEQWLMVGFEDSYDLYFQGTNDRPSAYVDVKIYGTAQPSVYDKMTGAICTILEETLQIPQSRIYVAYTEISNWGFNGSNF